MIPSPRWRELAAVAACGLALSGCASAQPHAPVPEVAQREVRILADLGRDDEAIIAELYEQTLEGEGRRARLVDSNGRDEVPQLLDGRADMAVGCTANFFHELDPRSAADLEAEAADASRDQDVLELTHVGLMGALPTTLTTVEPALAAGCEGTEEVDLPQNFVVLYQKGLLNRDERYEIASLTKFLTEEELTKIEESAEVTGNIPEAVALWMETTSSNPDSAQNDSNDDSTGASS